jgi:hypothetical protein
MELFVCGPTEDRCLHLKTNNGVKIILAMKSLIDFENRILKEYITWERVNESNWNIISYLNQFYDMNAALAFSKLYFPDFVDEKGCVILGFQFDKRIFNQWYEEFKGDISQTEKHCNLYDVQDYFHINPVNYETDEGREEAINSFANVLKVSWETSCKLLFPNRQMVVEIYNQYGATKITLFSQK